MCRIEKKRFKLNHINNNFKCKASKYKTQRQIIRLDIKARANYMFLEQMYFKYKSINRAKVRG